MKHLLKVPVAWLLALCARAIVRKYKPTIVMITGSVGKTSTKDAVAAVLAERHFLRASEKSYNSEFGVPLTIIGAKNPWENPAAWFGVFQEALALIMLPNHYPDVLVLEVGADRPGDLARILRIATPDAVVVTKLPDVPVHVEAYASKQAVRDEEFAPAYALADGKPLIISADDPHARAMAARLSVALYTFGFADDADVQITNAHFSEEEMGMSATLSGACGNAPLTVPGALGRPQLYAPAAAVATALALGMSATDALAGTKQYAPPPGRARIIAGKNNSLLVDDSYNASPAAVEEALAAVTLVPAKGDRYAVLGDMLELGRYSLSEHERIGTLAAQSVDRLYTVGERAEAMIVAARAAGMDESATRAFRTAQEAGKALAKEIGTGDVVLVKGSQSIRMERTLELLLADPTDAALLVRQEPEWKRR